MKDVDNHSSRTNSVNDDDDFYEDFLISAAIFLLHHGEVKIFGLEPPRKDNIICKSYDNHFPSYAIVHIHR